MKGLIVSLLGKEKMGKMWATLQHSCSSLGERVFSPDGGGVFTRGQRVIVHTLLLECVSVGKQTGRSDWRKSRVWWSGENEIPKDGCWTAWMKSGSWIPSQCMWTWKGLTLKMKTERKTCIMFPKHKGAAKLIRTVLTSYPLTCRRYLLVSQVRNLSLSFI